MRKLSIKLGLLVAIGCLASMVALSSITALFLMNTIVEQQDVVTQRAFPASLKATQLAAEASKLQQFTDRLDRASDSQSVQLLSDEFDLALQEARATNLTFRESAMDASLAAQVDELLNSFEASVAQYIEISSERTRLSEAISEADLLVDAQASGLNEVALVLVSNARATVSNRLSRMYDTVEDLYMIDATYDALDNILDVNQPYAARMADLRSNSLLLRQHALSLIAAADRERIDEVQVEISATIESLEHSIANIDDPDRQKQVRAFFGSIMTVMDVESENALLNAVIGLLETQVKADAARTALVALSENFEQVVSEIVSTMSAQIASSITSADQKVWLGRQTLIAFAVLAILASVLIGYLYVSRHILRRMSQISTATSELSSGKMDVAIPSGSHDELGRMATALDVFRDSMIERQRLEEETRKNEERQRQRAEEERAREAHELQQKAEEERLQREREEEQREERERVRNEADAERRKTQAEQELVVKELERGLTQLSSGALTYRITAEFPANYLVLRENFNDAMASLCKAISDVAANSDDVDVGAREISSATADLSTRTETSAASLEEAAAALTELSASAKSASGSAEQCSTFSQGAQQKAEDSRKVVENAETTMAEIEASGTEIENILKMMDDIAFQTNLLALNAGVEAARAGETGRGFAVVASEVRDLAARASTAAKEIGAIIDETNQKISKGVSLVEKTGSTLKDIIQDVGQISSSIYNIALAAEEQVTGISEVDGIVSQLETTMQQNAAMSEETRASTQHMESRTMALRGIVDKFDYIDDPAHESLTSKLAS